MLPPSAKSASTNAVSHDMALIDCPECGGKVSSAAVSCPVCGHPINQSAPPVTSPPPPSPPIQQRRVHTGLHLVLTIVTLGMWLPIWIGVVVWTNYANRREAQGLPYLSGGRIVGIGFAIYFALVVAIGALATVGGANSETATAESTTTSTRAPTTPPVTPETATAAQLIAMTSGVLRIGVEDILDSTTCDDLVFDFEFFMNNYTTTPRGERILERASELAAQDIGCSTYPKFP